MTELDIFFDGVPVSGGCEWRELAPLVATRNRLHDCDYALHECLDVHRPGTRQPEVLLRCEGLPDLVIERKSVVFDRDEVQRISHQDLFYEELRRGCRGLFANDLYQLRVRKPDVCRLKTDALRRAARTLARELRASGGGPACGNQPIPWTLTRVPAWDRDTSAGLELFVDGDALNPLDGPSCDEQLSRVANEIEKQLRSAARKFAQYEAARRVVALQCFGWPCPLLDDDVLHVIEQSSWPAEIDEVWLACKDWLDHDNFQVGWLQVRTDAPAVAG